MLRGRETRRECEISAWLNDVILLSTHVSRNTANREPPSNTNTNTLTLTLTRALWL